MTGRPPKPGTADIEISSGNYINLENPDPDPNVITLHVIAHHLSQVNRYGGAPSRPLCVAEHAILVASYLEHNGHPPGVILGGLHHDDSEAFLHDITRPLKELIKPLYEPIEKRMSAAIAQALNFEHYGIDVYHPAVTEADHWALAAEAYHHLPTGGREWWCHGLYEPNSPMNPAWVRSARYRLGMTPRFYYREWLDYHYKLCKRIDAERDRTGSAGVLS